MEDGARKGSYEKIKAMDEALGNGGNIVDLQDWRSKEARGMETG